MREYKKGNKKEKAIHSWDKGHKWPKEMHRFLHINKKWSTDCHIEEKTNFIYFNSRNIQGLCYLAFLVRLKFFSQNGNSIESTHTHCSNRPFQVSLDNSSQQFCAFFLWLAKKSEPSCQKAFYKDEIKQKYSTS